MPDPAADQELVARIADLQIELVDTLTRLGVDTFAARGLANRADHRGDVHRVAGLERAAERIDQARSLLASAASVLRMIEEPDEWPQESRSTTGRLDVPDELDRAGLVTLSRLPRDLVAGRTAKDRGRC